MFNIFKKKKEVPSNNIETEWDQLGAQFAAEINEMTEFGEAQGWENWKGDEPTDKRDHLAHEVLKLLREANKTDKIHEFREKFPPSHAPFVQFMENQAQSIEHLQFIDSDKIVFLTGTSWVKRQAYLLTGDKVNKLDTKIDAIGKSPQNNVFAFVNENIITTMQGWEGNVICRFELKETKNLGISSIIPFNDGRKVLFISSEGIYIISPEGEKMIHPVPDPEDEDWSANIDMENATLSNNNDFIVVGDQCSDHRILDVRFNEVGSIGPQSSYPHFCLFSKQDDQLITNSCHFYNGITIAVETNLLNGLKIEAYIEAGPFKFIDEEMRVYQGLATSKYYILGDAYGYVRAIDKKGKKIWRHFVGSTISGLTISDDEKTLWIGSYSGMVHKLNLGQGHRDNHTIGNGNHYEEFRLILWKDEEILKW